MNLVKTQAIFCTTTIVINDCIYFRGYVSLNLYCNWCYAESVALQNVPWLPFSRVWRSSSSMFICSAASICVAVHRPLNSHFCDCTQHSSFLEMLPSSKLYDILAPVRSVIPESVCSHWSNITENIGRVCKCL
jgi:hypothetical protein